MHFCFQKMVQFRNNSKYFSDNGDLFTFRSYSGCTAPGFYVHSLLPVPYILRFGNEEAKQKYLPDMVAGTTVGCLAMTEPAAGRYVLCRNETPILTIYSQEMITI